MSRSWHPNVRRWHRHPRTWKEQMWDGSQINSSNGQISDWLSEYCLTLNISKTACMYFYNRKNGNQPDVIVNGERIQTVSNLKYLGITVDSQLSFKKHEKEACNTVKLNLRNCRYIRNHLPLDAAKPYMHSWSFHKSHTVLKADHKLEKQHLLHCKHFTNKHSKHWTKSH